MNNSKNKVSDSLNLAKEAVAQDRANRVRFQPATWALIVAAGKEHGLAKVCRLFGLNGVHVRKRLKVLNLVEDTTSETTTKAQVNEANGAQLPDFAVVNFPTVPFTTGNDFKLQLRVGGQEIQIEGQSRSFAWDALFQSLGALRC